MQEKSRGDSAELRLCLKLYFPSEKHASVAVKAIQPDLNAGHARRSTTSIGIKNRIISLDIRAQDAVAMRASLNSCMNSIILSKSVMEE